MLNKWFYVCCHGWSHLRGHLEPTLRVVLADVSPLGIAGVRTGLAALIE